MPSGRGVGGRGRVGFESRFEAVHRTGLTDLIGREKEIDFLLERQRLAWKGEGQIVLISGEPGSASPACGGGSASVSPASRTRA